MGQFDDDKRKKRQKLLIYIALFVVFQTAIILIFTFTVMKFRTPKFRVRSAAVESPSYSNNSSFTMALNANLGVKNTNFGPFKYEATTVGFYYQNTPIGNATVNRSKANFRSTKKINVRADLASPASLAGNSQLTSDLNAGLLTLTSKSTMSGKITIMFLFKKKRTTNMDCTMDVNTNTNVIQNLSCK